MSGSDSGPHVDYQNNNLALTKKSLYYMFTMITTCWYLTDKYLTVRPDPSRTWITKKPKFESTNTK